MRYCRTMEQLNLEGISSAPTSCSKQDQPLSLVFLRFAKIFLALGNPWIWHCSADVVDRGEKSPSCKSPSCPWCPHQAHGSVSSLFPFHVTPTPSIQAGTRAAPENKGEELALAEPDVEHLGMYPGSLFYIPPWDDEMLAAEKLLIPCSVHQGEA